MMVLRGFSEKNPHPGGCGGNFHGKLLHRGVRYLDVSEGRKWMDQW